MTAKLLRDLPRPLAVPAAYNQFGVEDPVGRRMRTLGQLAHLALLGGVERRTGRHMFGHGEPPLPTVHADFTPRLRNDAMTRICQVGIGSPLLLACMAAD